MTKLEIKTVLFHLNKIHDILNPYIQEKHRTNAKKVQCVETGIVYDSISKAGKQNNIQPVAISWACSGKLKTAGGLHWKYLN